MAITVTLDKTKEVVAAIKAMTEKRVLIGIPESKGNRSGKNNKLTNAQIAYIQTNGSPINNIPASPFLEPGIKKEQEKIIGVFRDAAKKAFSEPAEIEKAFEKVGLIGQAAAKNAINTGEGFAPLSPKTIAARRRRKKQSTQRLVDTGQMLNSITYVVEEK